MKNKLLKLIKMSSKFTFYGLITQLLLFNFLLASNGNAQLQQKGIESIKEARITLHLKNASIEQIFQAIEKRSDYEFFYDRNFINKNIRIDVNNTGVLLSDLLLVISKKAQLKFRQVNNVINVSEITNSNEKDKIIEVIIQTRNITGKVTSMEDNEGLPGVNVVEKGTRNGTVTNVQGNYSLEVSEGATLVFSSVGYTTEEVEVGNRSVIDVTMVQDLQQLQELVVIGYGQQRKEDLSGSVVSIDAKTLERIPNASFEQALQGRVPGVQITQASNAPGGGISVRIRGGNSITGGNEPLYVIDGVQINANNEDLNPGGNNNFTLNKDPAGNALASLNPQDIESIEVLKDASATAIYGSRGSNGVVLITTKQGTAGQSSFSYESYYSIQTAATRYDAMNVEQYLDFYNDIEINRTALDDSDNEVRTLSPALTSQFANTDWQDEIFNPALMQSQTFRFAGGSKDLSYNASFNYFNQDGVVESTGFKRYSIRLNTNGQVNDKISFGNSFTFTNSTRNAGIVNGNGHRGDDIVMAALQSPPIQPVRDANGFFYATTRDWQNELEEQTGESFLFPLGRTQNPLLTAREAVNDIVINRVIGNIFGQVEIAEGLRAKISVGGDFADVTRDYFLSNLLRSSDEEGFAVKSTRRNISLINTNTLHYDRSFNGNTLNLMGGFEMQTNRNESLRASASNFFTNTFKNNALQAGNEFDQPSTGLTEWAMASFFARGNYILKDKYIFTATVRTDGSSRFGVDNRWGFFPSGAFAWRLSNEPFMDNLGFISNAKVRASYGLTGNTDIGSFRSLATYSPNANYIFGGNQFSGTSPDRIANPDLKWERTAQWNIGLDFSILNDRLSITAEVYSKTTNDLLLERSIPATSGFTTSLQNVGSVENRGVELVLDADVVQGTDFTWNANANISFNRNEVLDLGGAMEIILGSGLCSRACWNNRDILLQVGQPIGLFRGYTFDGIWQSQEQIDNSTIEHGNPSPRVGGVRYADVNGDGAVNTEDIGPIGDPTPNFIYGFTNNFTYRNFDLSVFVQGSQGNEVLNHTLNDLLYMGMGGRQSRMAGSANSFMLDGSTPEINQTTKIGYAGFGHNDDIDSRIVEDASFLQIRNVILGYSLPNNAGNWMKNLRLYFSIQNLATFTNYSGFDPDVNIGGQSNIVRGHDIVGLPITRSYTFGVNVSF
jgi:TonB-dependent starch-binding outer membrane protein SusC